MPITAAIIGGGLGLIGSSMTASSARDAAATSAAAQTEAARLAAEQAKFRPVGITTRFGSSQFGFSPEGYLTSAGYNLSPELKAYQDRLMEMSRGQLGQAEAAQDQYAPLTGAATGLFNLASKYLSESPEQVAASYMAKQQELLAPTRERQMAQLQNQLFQQGRGGLSVGATSARPSGAAGLGATTPEMEAYYNALAQQDAALAAQAQQAGQQQLAFGTGLFNTGANLLGLYQAGQVGALSPFQASLAATQALEALGQEPLTLGAGLGGQQAAYGARAGSLLQQGGQNAALTMQAANRLSPFGDAFSGLSTDKGFAQGLSRLFSGGDRFTGNPSGLGIGGIDYVNLRNIYSSGNPFAGQSWDGE